MLKSVSSTKAARQGLVLGREVWIAHVSAFNISSDKKLRWEGNI